jgi:hypothetical protein
MSRNNERVLSDAMIFDIKAKLFSELEWTVDRTDLINDIMDAYLTDDWDSFKQMLTETIEDYEDEILLTLNMEIREDLENQTEDHV